MQPRSVAELETFGPIRIKSVDVMRLAVPMLEPFRISSGEVSCKDATLIRLENSQAFGWGESSAMQGAFYSSDTPDSCTEQILKLAPSLSSKEFRTMKEFEQHLRDQRLSPFVRVAFETAAWELLARERGESLRRLFGLQDAPVPTGLAVGLYPTQSELKSALERYDVKSYSRLKIKIKRGQDVALVRAVRDWLGDFPLFVDANADYTRDDLKTFLELDSYDLMMFEQPFARSDKETSSLLQRQVKTPVCFDEGIETAEDVHIAASTDACRVVNIKLQRVGGYLEAFRIAEACQQAALPFWMGTMPELGIGSAQALILATHPGNKFPTDVEPSKRWYAEDILSPELKMENGQLNLPAGNGLGFEVERSLIKKYETASWSFV